VVQELARFSNPDLLEAEWFNDIFRGVFNEAVMKFSGPLCVADFIDVADECDGLHVDYDAGATYCAITFEGFNGTITITSDSLTYRFRKAETPKEMALQLQTASTLLLGMSEMQRALPL